MAQSLERILSTPMAWSAETVLDKGGVVYLNEVCLSELEQVVEELIANPIPAVALSPDYFKMPECQALMLRVREQIDTGIGLAIIDRLPVEKLEEDVAKKIYWLLMSMIGKPVAQKWDGTMLYDVTDEGGVATAGSGIRSSKTNEDQGYHIDNAFNLPPDNVSLLCLQTAKEGGTSGIISFETVHNLLLQEHAEALSRLYEPFHFDRQTEHAPGDVRTVSKPIFEVDGETIKTNYSPNVIYRGYKMMDGEMDEATASALQAMQDVSERKGIGKNLEFERGQIQILNNRRIGHRRTAYTDWPELERRRHMVRIWLRETGRPFYHG
jgi:hypothetical protein